MNKKQLLDRLRGIKANAIKAMEALNAEAKTRALSDAEQKQFDALKSSVEDANAGIESLEREITPEPQSQPAVNAEELARKAVESERLRQQEIRSRVASAKLPEALAAELCNSNATTEEATRRIFEEMAKLSAEQPKINPKVEITRDQRDTFREEMKAALMHRMDPRDNPLKDGLGRRFAGRRLAELAEASLKAAGCNTDMLTRDEIINGAIMGLNGNTSYLAGAGMHTTSDFPNILADVANKRLRKAYEAAPRTFTGFCRQTTAPDFKNINATMLSDMSPIKSLNEHGEYVSLTISDGKETYKLKTYGGILRITRQTIINDDLRALDEAPRKMGVAGARLENETVWGVITANAAMSDTVALFHATHANLLTGGGSALALAGLAAARAALRKQTAPQGQVLNLTPSYLIVPAALEMTALQLVVPNSLAANQVSNVVPEWIRTLMPVVEPLLDANSATAWYLAADPGVVDTIEYCYLEGQQGMYTESRNGFEVDGIEIKGRLDFAAAAIDYRGLQKNAGA